MSTDFPGAIDSYDALTDNDSDVLAQHPNNRGDALEAIEAKMGIDSSAVVTSIDYLLKSASSVDPGHQHNIADSDISGNNWKTMYTNGSGVITELALGTSGKVLQANGVSSAPTWETPSATGGVGWINVVDDFGADNTGASETSAEIQAAIDSAGGYDTIWFPPGIYKIDTKLSIDTTNAHILGSGASSSIIYTESNISMFEFDCTAGTMHEGFIKGLAFYGNVGGTRSSNYGIHFTGATANGVSYFTFDDLHFRGTYNGIRISKTTGGAEVGFNWSRFTNIKTSNYGAYQTEDAIYFVNGSGTGNIFANMNLVVGSHGIVFLANDGSNVGDILIQNIAGGGGSTALAYFGSAAAYRQRITINNCQCDAGMSNMFTFHGAAYGYLKLTSLLYGGGTSFNFDTNPTHSLVELPTGLYGYNSSGTRSTIYAY